jgi:ribosomal protein S10
MLISFFHFSLFFKFCLQSFDIKQLYSDFKVCYKQIKLFLCQNMFIKLYRVPNSIKKFTVIRSPFIFKKSKEQFEFIKFKAYIVCRLNTSSFVLNLLFIFLLFKACINNVFSLIKICIKHSIQF